MTSSRLSPPSKLLFVGAYRVFVPTITSSRGVCTAQVDTLCPLCAGRVTLPPDSIFSGQREAIRFAKLAIRDDREFSSLHGFAKHCSECQN